MKRIALTALAAGLISYGVLVAPAVAATNLTVQATDPIASWADTGLTLVSSQTYAFSVLDPSRIWSAGSNIPVSRDSTADGIPADAGYGQFTSGGFTANYGALVGEAGSTFFLIGTSATLSGLAGDLKVGYWDSNYGDNSGFQDLMISAAVPEPATWAMFILGFGVIGWTLRSRRDQRGVAALA